MSWSKIKANFKAYKNTLYNIGMGKYVKRRERAKYNQREDKTKTAFQLETESLKDRIYMEYMKQGGFDNGVCMTDVVCKFRPNRSRNANWIYGYRILNDPDVKRRIQVRNAKRIYSSKLDFQDRINYLTGVILGEIELDAEAKDRLKAVDIMNKMEGVYVNKSLNVNQNISIDEEREIIQKRLNQLLAKDTEVKEVEKETIDE